MEKVIIARFGEVHLKGGNRPWFLKMLRGNLAKRLDGIARVALTDNRFVITGFANADDAATIAKNTFGIISVSVVKRVDVTPEAIMAALDDVRIDGTFKVAVNRANKRFVVRSTEFAATCGGVIMRNNPNVRVDLSNPRHIINIDIREQCAFVYENVLDGVGGLPVGTAGRAVVLLSGGIDSPVAAFLGAKRGLNIDFVHFATPPYTSELALAKVEKLGRIVGEYTGGCRLFVIPFTEISRAIQKNCDHKYMITIMRRFMVRIAERVGLHVRADCIMTGENLAQVASQTIEGIASNNFVATRLPILRPLITFDKSEIVALAKRIGTYEVSIEPHEDCCTVFVPANPVIKPNIRAVEAEEEKLDIDGLVNRANASFAGN
ncbi:MAG: tRNA 4-thiouridine(8) synthase ThiI [Firmicutes bacterium]|nr:tRNA 4-thiouridine(8) synthase ThiI [Bacillota bacterium]